MTEISGEYDSPWKEAIELYFPDFMAFFFPQAHANINWERSYEFLDTELQQVVRDAELGRRLADKLVKVWRLSGEESWVLIHLEVQAQVETDFAKRMYIYNYRLFDRYERQVVSLAVLGDEQATWRPRSYGYELWGCRVSLEFPTVKLLDYEAQWQTLEQSINPFAIVVMAHLKTKATLGDPQSRFQWKLSLIRNLYQRGYSREEVLQLFRLIQWMMVLPEELERNLEAEVSRYEEERRMPYITTFERRAMLKTLRENVIEILDARFEVVPPSIIETVNQLGDLDGLKQLLRRAVTINSLEEFQQLLESENPAN